MRGFKSDQIRPAIEAIARSLPPGDPSTHVFLEDRIDHRVTVRSGGPAEVRATRSCGMTVAGPGAVHRTDTPGRLLAEVDEDNSAKWVADLQAEVESAGGKASAGFRQPFWTARIVAFRQLVWVGLPGGVVFRDSRRGCRVTIRAGLGGAEPTKGVHDLVLADRGPWPLVRGFEQAFERAERSGMPGSAPPTGQTAVVLAAGAAGVVVHELIGHALEADVVIAGRSWIGVHQLPPAGRTVTVVDDPRLGRGAWSIDDEGETARETVLVERGRRVGMLVDRSTGKVLGVESTGHGRRSTYLDAVRPRMGCTFIRPGDDDAGEILHDTPAGLFIRRLDTGHTDPVSGRATFVVSDADRIVGGRLAEPVAAFVLELDGPRAWSSIDRVADDLLFDSCVGSCSRDGQPLAVSVGAPTIRIGVATVRS